MSNESQPRKFFHISGPPPNWDGSLEQWPEAQAYGFVVDDIFLGPTFAHGNVFPIISFQCKAVPGKTPSVCPKAKPSLPEEYLAEVECSYREVGLIGKGQTLHWVGNQETIEHVCTCFKERDDKRDDTTKKTRNKKRLLTKEASACVRNYKKLRGKNEKVSMIEVVENYVAENGGSVTGLMRRLNDHPDKWKDAT